MVADLEEFGTRVRAQWRGEDGVEGREGFCTPALT
jgi:hypothetical protein